MEAGKMIDELMEEYRQNCLRKQQELVDYCKMNGIKNDAEGYLASTIIELIRYEKGFLYFPESIYESYNYNLGAFAAMQTLKEKMEGGK